MRDRSSLLYSMPLISLELQPMQQLNQVLNPNSLRQEYKKAPTIQILEIQQPCVMFSEKSLKVRPLKIHSK